jgi:hypothetical protein
MLRMIEKTAKICFVVMSIVIISCSGSQEKSLVQDQGSPKKVNLLKERANQFWEDMVKGDLREAYKYYDPFFRAKMDVETFSTRHNVIKYREAKVTDVKVEGNIGTVKVKVTYYVPHIKVKNIETSVPDTNAEFEERWLFVYDNWYKEYYLESIDARFAWY